MSQKNKKAVSIMIGYVLLVTFAVIIGVIVYQWMKTYVPTDLLECPEGVSVFVKDVVCENIGGGNFKMNLILKNNGRFDIAGYFIHATNDSNQTLATVDLSKYLVGGIKMGSAILFVPSKNAVEPNNEKFSAFNLTNQIYSIEITPIRFQVMENKKRLVSCGGSKIRELINC